MPKTCLGEWFASLQFSSIFTQIGFYLNHKLRVNYFGFEIRDSVSFGWGFYIYCKLRITKMPLSRERGYKIVIINDMIIRSERSQTDERAESDRKNLMPLSPSASRLLRVVRQLGRRAGSWMAGRRCSVLRASDPPPSPPRQPICVLTPSQGRNGPFTTARPFSSIVAWMRCALNGCMLEEFLKVYGLWILLYYFFRVFVL